MSNRSTKEEINKIFNLFLLDNGTEDSEYITIKNLKKAAKEMEIDITDEELQEIIRRADSNNDKKVTADDFYNIMTKKIFN